MSDNELSVDIQSLTNKNWKLKEYSDRQIDFISPVSYTHLTLPTKA